MSSLPTQRRRRRLVPVLAAVSLLALAAAFGAPASAGADVGCPGEQA